MNNYQLIENYFFNKKEEFSRFKLFEAGFGDFGETLDLYNKIPFKKYIGLEVYEKSKIQISYIDSYGSRSTEFSSNDSIYERYLNYLQNTCIDMPILEGRFNEKFILIFEKRIENYIYEVNSSKEFFDLGIFSNLFHKFSDKVIPKQILKWFYNTSNMNSYLYIKVMTSHKHAYEKIDYIYSQNDIIELLECFPGEIICKKDSDSFESFLIRKHST